MACVPGHQPGAVVAREAHQLGGAVGFRPSYSSAALLLACGTTGDTRGSDRIHDGVSGCLACGLGFVVASVACLLQSVPHFIKGGWMRLWIISALALLVAAGSSADVVKMQSGSEIECVVIQENTDTIVIRRGYGTMTIPRSIVASVSKSPVITAANVAPVVRRAPSQRIPAWSDILGALVKTKWATNLQPIPATVVDVGVMRHVPYQSYRCGTDYEVNIYGDPDRPAAIEIGIYRAILNSDEAKRNCVELVASVLSDPTDAGIVRVLNRAQDLVTRAEMTIEITPHTSPDAYGGWWVSVYNEKELDAARASEDELKQITVARAAPVEAAPKPAAPRVPAAQAAKPVIDSDDWTSADLRNSRPSAASGGGSVYVRGYYRKDGTYVRPHTRRR